MIEPDEFVDSPGGGGTHIFDRTGMCRSNGSLFYNETTGGKHFACENGTMTMQ